jgi:hypothetical protein
MLSQNVDALLQVNTSNALFIIALNSDSVLGQITPTMHEAPVDVASPQVVLQLAPKSPITHVRSIVGTGEGAGEGAGEGPGVGKVDGRGEGTTVGKQVGILVGEGDGRMDGKGDGGVEGLGDGIFEGLGEGAVDGDCVGTVH